MLNFVRLLSVISIVLVISCENESKLPIFQKRQLLSFVILFRHLTQIAWKILRNPEKSELQKFKVKHAHNYAFLRNES